MARKTKEEAGLTREAILDAAERLFQARGVAATSLHDIAVEAGVTRGAVYWHFRDKADLFDAMVTRIDVPLEPARAALSAADPAQPLQALRGYLRGIVRVVATDERVRRVLEIKLQKVEYVGATHRVGEQRRRARADHVAAIETLMRRAQRAGQLARQPAARHQALGVDALLLGLIENWLMDPAAFDLVRVGDAAIDAHLRGLAPAGVPA